MTGRTSRDAGAKAPRGGARRRRWFDPGPRTYKLLWDGHSATGVVFGLALFVIFFCGSLALYREEFRGWVDPALRGPIPENASLDALVTPVFEANPPAVGGDMLLVMPFGDRAYYYIGYESESGEGVARWISASTGEVLPSNSRTILPDLLNDLHFFSQGGRPGETVAGLVGLILFFSVVTGLLVHLRKLPQDLHTFRPFARLKVALADLHTALGTVGAPFVAIFAVTGAYFSLTYIVFGGFIVGAMQGDALALNAFLPGVDRIEYEASEEAAPPLSFDALLGRIPPDWPPLDISALEIEGWGDADGIVFLEGSAVGSLGRSGAITMELSSGEILTQRAPAETPAMTATAVTFTTLHLARFGGGLLKALFFVLGLAGSAVALTGNLLWIESRRPSDPSATPWVHTLLARLTSGVGAGLVAAVPVLFLVSNAVPIEVPSRTDLEQAFFFWAWAIFAAVALVVPGALRSARWLIGFAGALALLVPLADGVGTGAWPWVSAVRGDAATFSIDVAFFVIGCLTVVFTVRKWPASLGGATR